MSVSRMIAPVKDNAEKYETYREQISLYNKAIREGFYLQAIVIDYALLEDRLRSFLYHMGVFADRKSTRINVVEAKEALSEMVQRYKRIKDKETDSMSITNISGKMKVIRCAIEWSVNAENIKVDDTFRFVLKNRLEGLDLQELLCIIEEASGWCKYRNEIIHCLLNKNSYAVNEIVQAKAEEGFKLARRLDDQVRILKKGNYIRKHLNLRIDKPTRINQGMKQGESIQK